MAQSIGDKPLAPDDHEVEIPDDDAEFPEKYKGYLIIFVLWCLIFTTIHFKCKLTLKKDFMKHSFFGALKKGLFALAPLVITFALIRWIYESLESVFGSLLEMIVGKQWYFPGLGILMALLLIVIVGYLLDYLLIQKIYNFGETMLTRIPLVKTLYGSLRQFMSFFKADDKKMGQAVRVRIGDNHMLGIMTRQDLASCGLSKEHEVAVFLPMSYQMGGYTILVKRSDVEILNIPVEEMLKFSVSAGVLTETKPEA